MSVKQSPGGPGNQGPRVIAQSRARPKLAPGLSTLLTLPPEQLERIRKADATHINRRLEELTRKRTPVDEQGRP